MAIQVSLSLPEIYTKLCPKCKKTLQELVKERVADQAIKESLEGKKELEVE